jgi:pimeloyl-ACP methyl ester carboxylesterase
LPDYKIARMPSLGARRSLVEVVQQTCLRRGDATITVHVRGTGPLVALVPSLGRAAADFNDLAGRLVAAGYATAAIDPRGLDGEGVRQPLTLHDLTEDTAFAIKSLALGPAHLVGHALGNRISRCLTAEHPDLVASLTLLAAGGLVAPATAVVRALLGCFELDRDPVMRLRDVEFAFFAPSSDASVWRDGWYPFVAIAQFHAALSTERAAWWSAVAPRVLVIQGLQDRIALPENARRYVADVARHATLCEIDGAGHALLPERPVEIAATLIDFLNGRSAHTKWAAPADEPGTAPRHERSSHNLGATSAPKP